MDGNVQVGRRRKDRQLLTRTYSRVGQSALCSVSSLLINCSCKALALSGLQTRRHDAVSAPKQRPRIPRPGLQRTQLAGPALYSSRLGNARGWTRLFALIWQQPGQTWRAVDTAFFQLAGWRLGQGFDDKGSGCKRQDGKAHSGGRLPLRRGPEKG